jgi:catechol 2,3-dioxygenase-like lactoylglutathione lyase family enzyme
VTLLGHLSFGVSDLGRSTTFYDAIMAALGFRRVWTSANGVGYGLEPDKDKLALFPRADAAPPGPGFHLAFDADSQPRWTPSTPRRSRPAGAATARRACVPITAKPTTPPS